VAAKSRSPQHDRASKNGRLADPFGKATIFNQSQRHSRPVAPADCTGWHLYLLTHCRQTQMHRPSKQGGGGPPQPPGPPNLWPPQPGPPPRPPPQSTNCAWWTTPGAACGVAAAFATPARPMAEKPIAPAIAPAPTIFFRDHAIPFSDVNSWPENVPVDTYPKVDSLSMNRLCPAPASPMRYRHRLFVRLFRAVSTRGCRVALGYAAALGPRHDACAEVSFRSR